MPAFVGQKHRPPPQVHEENVDAFAHCPDARCEGNEQEPVKAVKQTVEYSYASLDGDWPFTQNTNEYIRFADETGSPCSHCGRTREVSMQVRPQYQPLSGFAQDGLLNVPKFDPRKRNTEADERQAAELAEMRRMMAAQAEQIAALTQKATRGPGRPPKDAQS